MITFLLMNLIVGASAFLLNYRILRFRNFIDSLLSLFILYFSQIVLTELFLGIWGKVFIQNVILLNLAILFVIWALTRNKESSFCFGVGKYKTFLTTETSQGRVLSPPTSLANEVSCKISKEQLSQLLGNKIILFAAAIILAFASIKILINLVNPPFGWDNLNYHFTFPVEWLKHGNLGNPITISDDFSPTYYPINGSLFFLWLIFPFKNVFLADLGQIPFFVLAFLSTYNISKKIGLNKDFSLYAAILFLLIPNFFKQLQIAYVDVMVASLFLVCLNYLISLYQEFSPKNLLLYSMSLGLFLGIKTVALPYSILLFLPFVLLFFKHSNKYSLFIFSILIIIALGGFSYLRNFIETRNPFYPLDFKLFGLSIFKGVIDIGTYRAHFKPEDYSLAKLLFHEGLGVQTILFILPSIFLALPVTLIKKRKMPGFILTYFLILPFLIYLVYRYIIPLPNTRYLYPLLGIGMIIGFYTVGILGMPRRLINILVAICLLASLPELAKRQELIASVMLTFLLFFLLPPFIKYIGQKWLIKKHLFIYLPLLFIFLIIPLLALLEKDYVNNEYSRYASMVKYSGFWPDATRAWDWLNRNTQRNNIAYIGRPVSFPLYGTNFKNNVYYVSVNKTEPAKLHYFPNSHYHWGYDFLSMHRNLEEEGNYRSDADYSVWLDNLNRRNTDYLFVYSLHQTKDIEFPLEDAWAGANPGKFSPVFTNETIHIYKIIR